MAIIQLWVMRVMRVSGSVIIIIIIIIIISSSSSNSSNANPSSRAV